MRIIKYRFTDPKDGAEHGGLCTTVKEAEKVTKEISGIRGPWWNKSTKFEWEVLTFDRKTNGIMDALYMAMEFAHDLHEIAPMATTIAEVKVSKEVPKEFRRSKSYLNEG